MWDTLRESPQLEQPLNPSVSLAGPVSPQELLRCFLIPSPQGKRDPAPR